MITLNKKIHILHVNELHKVGPKVYFCKKYKIKRIITKITELTKYQVLIGIEIDLYVYITLKTT